MIPDAPAQTVHQPFDIDIEQAALGAMIRDSSLVPQAMAILDADGFFDPLHGRIYATIIAWSQEDRPITSLTLQAELKSDPGILTIGEGYFEALRSAAPSTPTVGVWARIIRDLALRRDALAAIAEATDSLTGTPTAISTALRPIMAVADMAERITAASTFKTAYEAGLDSIRAAERASAGKPVRAVRTGLTGLDNETGGLQGADFIVVAGRSGMGKSALMGGVSWRAAMAGYPVIVFSMEMTRAQWVQRIITDMDFDDEIQAPIEYRKFRSTGVSATGTGLGFTAGEFARIVLANQRLQDIPWLEIHEDDGLTMAQIVARSRAFQAKWKNDPRIRELQQTPEDEYPIGLVISDYLQIVAPHDNRAPREQQVRDIARGHKALAKTLDWPVMAGSQMNEDEKTRGSGHKRPQAGDVRESKSIFHEAVIMLAPYRPAWYVQQEKPDGGPGDPAWIKWKGDMALVRHKFELLGVKNRMGRPFELDLHCEIGSNSIRDDAPVRRASQQLADDMLGGR